VKYKHFLKYLDQYTFFYPSSMTHTQNTFKLTYTSTILRFLKLKILLKINLFRNCVYYTNR